MMKRVAAWLMSLSGWSVNMNYPPEVRRCVMTAAPHTSNWDFWYARLAFFVMGVPVRFTIKKLWMHFPLSLVIGPLGGIPITAGQGKINLEGQAMWIKSPATSGNTSRLPCW